MFYQLIVRENGDDFIPNNKWVAKQHLLLLPFFGWWYSHRLPQVETWPSTANQT